jgi:hypothetical protein
LLQLLRGVRQRYSNRVHLLSFVDCLVVLDIIRKWGRSDFHPSPKEVVHFVVIYPLLQESRRWIGKVTLVKVKSHTGCLLNEHADELDELGRQAETLEIGPGPQSMVLSSCESDLQCENTPARALKNVPNPSQETVLLLAVCSMLWWLSTLCVPSRNAALCSLQISYTSGCNLQSYSTLQIGRIPGMAQMHDWDIPSPVISSAHRSC